MFDIGSGELLVIGVVALVAIGPKELPGVLRMVGQWVTKARRMATDFQSQFHDALREAEMADLKKSFDDVTDAAKGLSSANLLGTPTKDLEEALKDGDASPAATEPAAATAETSHSSEIETSDTASSGADTSDTATSDTTTSDTSTSDTSTSEVHTAELAPPTAPHDPAEGGTGS